ncbi:cupin domain-containing protein [Thermotoga profunda]|uniref:cupin domain-containing protein n=1 Tax=Thermotoga profunda TaxID=1508420 RepID=UPI0005975A54|nr:cupin domain-containing protein [Thermotoga profunda]
MNLLENIPYSDEQMGRRKIVDQKHLLIMQIALKPGQSVPEHKANSNVHLLVLKGSITVTLNNMTAKLKEGDLLPIEYQTPMSIKNNGDENATFLVIKTPNPSEMEK